MAIQNIGVMESDMKPGGFKFSKDRISTLKLGVMENWSDEKNPILQFSNILILVS